MTDSERGCLRCHECNISYPPDAAGCLVKGCSGMNMARLHYSEPDADWRDKVAARNERTLEEALAQRDELYEHRVRQYERLGYPDWAAEVLASAVDPLGFPLYWGDVKALIDAGATPAQALRIVY